MVKPGETVKAAIWMLNDSFFTGELEVGMEFDFMEGNQIMGTGVITEIINKSLEKLKTP